ncbi:hypothetical protein CONCODRAFT_13118, partial [Conidiobolus coronatus NRRL 28638]
FVFRIWSFELTTKFFPTPSRKNKLAQRKQEQIVRVRLDANIKKVKAALTVVQAVNAFQK